MYEVAIIVVLLIIFLWYASSAPVFNSAWLDEVNFKTGDLICFKATNNYNSILMMNYFTHVGIIVINPSDHTPYIFEAFEVSGYKFKDSRHANGVLFTPLKERILRYKGYCYLKPLEHAIEHEKVVDFYNFINFAHENMEYNYNIITNCFSKWLGKPYTCKTNCAEIVALSLVKLGLLKMDQITGIFNHIKFVTNLVDLQGNRYLPHVELMYESVEA